MTLNLYATKSEKNRIGKGLVLKKTTTGVLRNRDGGSRRNRDDGSRRNPILQVQNDSNVDGSNYAYISEYGRYYFIVEKRPINNSLVELVMVCDVLESFATQIKNNEVLIERSERYNESFIVDNSRPAFNYPMVLTRKFGADFDAFNYYLTVASGEPNE